MATANTLQTLNGLFKETYDDKIENLIPDGVKLMPNIKFVQRAKQPGNFYHAPVILGLEHGVTFAGGDDGAFNLNAPIAGQMKDAQIRGTQMVLRSVLSYAAASRATEGDGRAFEDSTKFLVANMMRSMAKKLEIEMLYGDVGYGEVDSTSGNTITIKTAEWAPGIWAGAENLRIEIRSSSGSLRGDASVQSVDMENRQITVDALPAGVSSGDVIWHFGAYNKEFAGIHKILTNNSSLFGIDASQYSLWKGNEKNIGGALTFDELDGVIARAVEKGLDKNVTVYVNTRTWSDLMTDQAAKRSYDSSYSSNQFEQGAESIKFHSQNGMLEIVPSIYVKEGYSYAISHDDFVRVGSTDITFRRPGQEDEFFRDLEDSAGYELRAYTDQALFCQAPGRQALAKGINNGA